MSIIYFILLIGPLIFFHELGHFLAARYFGVGVIRFSIGFGPKIAGFTRKGTEFVIGALPLGGFVRMVGMEPGETAQLPEEERKRALWAKPIWQRSLIVLAGPLANLILPLPIFVAVYMFDDDRLPARVGAVVADSPADEGGLETGDTILSINGEELTYFDELQGLVADADDRPLLVVVDRDGEEVSLTLPPPEHVQVRDRWVGLRTVDRARIGISATIEGSLIHVPDTNSPAFRSGLRTFDRVVRFNGEPVTSLIRLNEMAAATTDSVELVVMRPESMGTFMGVFVEVPHRLTLQARAGPNPGWESAGMVLQYVQPGSPAETAGLRVGDQIRTVDGRRYNLFRTLLERLWHEWEQPHEIVFLRDGVEMTTSLTAVNMDVVGDFNAEVNETFVGMRTLTSAQYYPHARDQFETVSMSAGERVVYGISNGFKALFGFIIGIVVGVWQLISGQVGLSNLGGPIMIFDVAGRAGSAGAEPFLRIMGLISINLGILNLLPIPVLDGGNLLLFAIEAVKRSPITIRTRQVANYIGLAMLLVIFMLVFKNDIERYWSNFAEFFD